MRVLNGMVLSAAFAAASALASPAVAAEYELDASHTRVGFSVRHLMISNVKGEFRKYDAKVTIDDKDVTKSSFAADIDTASVNTNMDKRDEHLRSPDFFDSAKFAKMTFKSTKVEKVGTKLKITGNLTIRDVTKVVVLEGTLTAPQKDPFVGASHVGFSAEGKISRKDFGLTWNKALEGGGLTVGDEVTLQLEGELTQKAPKA